jgi:hypothetical protein
MTHPIEAVRTLVGQEISLGEPCPRRGFTLVPLFGRVETPLTHSYVLAADAIVAGTLFIEESGGGEVPRLVVRNPGDLPVLLVEGEHLEGARQDRVLNVSVLVAARHDTHIPVSCVEHGRWGYRGSQRFAPAPEFSHVNLRAMKVAAVARDARTTGGRHSDQGGVWAEVDRKRAEVGAGYSSTGAMGDAYRDRGRELDGLVAAFGAPQAGQRGVIVCVGGRPVATDVFDRPETLAGLWPRLSRGYAVDALGAPERDVIPADLDRFLARVQDADATSREGVGLGSDVVLTADGFVATALVWEEAVVHLAMFSNAPVSGRGRPGRIASPRQRSRSWFRDEQTRPGASPDISG